MLVQKIFTNLSSPGYCFRKQNILIWSQFPGSHYPELIGGRWDITPATRFNGEADPVATQKNGIDGMFPFGHGDAEVSRHRTPDARSARIGHPRESRRIGRNKNPCSAPNLSRFRRRVDSHS